MSRGPDNNIEFFHRVPPEQKIVGKPVSARYLKRRRQEREHSYAVSIQEAESLPGDFAAGDFVPQLPLGYQVTSRVIEFRPRQEPPKIV